MLAALNEAGIHGAFSGWQVLREQFPEDRHYSIISQYPEIVNGVILADADDLEAAVEATAGLPLTAPTSLAAGTGVLSEEQPATVIVAGPAALHDSAAADIESTRRNAQLEASERLSNQAAARGDAAQHARTQLVSFIESKPAATVDTLQVKASDLASQITAAENDLAAATDSRSAAESDIDKATESHRSVQAKHGDARRAETSLRRLKDRPRPLRQPQRALDGAEDGIP